MRQLITLHVNGETHEVAVHPHHEPRLGEEPPQNAMPWTLILRSHRHSSPVCDLTPWGDLNLERRLGWK